MNSKIDISERLKSGQKVAFIATGLTCLLALLKMIIGSIFESKILIADAIHSGADSFAILASGFGLWLAGRKKSEKFPYGLFKAETFISFIVGILILLGGFEIARDGLERFFLLPPSQPLPVLPVIAALFSIIVSYFIARKEKAVGEQINSHSLLANAKESFLDIIISIIVLFGLLLTYIRIPYVEGSVIFLISLLVLKLGIETAWTSLLILLDANLDKNMRQEIEKRLKMVNGIQGVDSVKIRQSGPFKMIECIITINPFLPLHEAHLLADKAEDIIICDFEHIESVFIHLEPYREKFKYALFPVKNDNALDSVLCEAFGKARYFIIVKFDENNIKLEKCMINQFFNEKRGKGIKLIKNITKNKLDILFTSQIGEIPFYILKENFIDIYHTIGGTTIKEVIEQYRKNQAKEITAPTHSFDDGHWKNHFKEIEKCAAHK